MSNLSPINDIRLTELEGYKNIRWFDPYMNKFKKVR